MGLLQQGVGLLAQLAAIGGAHLIEQGQVGLQLLQGGVDEVEAKRRAL